MKLGTKVKCKGYYSKLTTAHVVTEENKRKPHHYNDVLVIKDEPIEQDLYKLIEKEFEGIVVSRKNIYISRTYEECYVWCKGDVSVFTHDRKECYQVFFRMGGSRLVPINMCEVIDSET